MSHSTVTSKGQTTIPGEVRRALHIQPGDRLEYELADEHATIHVHRGLRALAGALHSDRGRGRSFAQIRAAAARARRQR